MENLNDDCLLETFKLLTLEQQVTVLQVCHRFHNLITSLWQVKYKTVDFNYFYDKGIDNYIFRIFIASICATVEVVNLGCITQHKFELLCRFTFPKVQSLRYTPDFYVEDYDINALTRIFPNVRTFHPIGLFSGKYINQWSQLEDLTCSVFEAQYLRQILKESTKLKSLKLGIFENEVQSLDEGFENFSKLEKITLNSCELSWVCTNKFKNFTQLKEISVTDDVRESKLTKLYQLISKYKSNNVLAIATQISKSVLPFAFNFNVNLQKLTFFLDDYAFEEICKYLQHLPALRQIYFLRCAVEEESHVIKMLQESQQLEIINIYECIFNFSRLTLKVPDIVEQRSNLLNFNFYDNIIMDGGDFVSLYNVQLELQGQSHLFKLCQKSESFPVGFLKFTFQQQ